MEESAKLGASYHPVEQVPRVGACAGTGTQALAAEWLHRLCEARRSLLAFDRSQGKDPALPFSILPQLLTMQTYLDRRSTSGCPPRRGAPASGPGLGRNVQEKYARRQRGRSGSLLPGLLNTRSEAGPCWPKVAPSPQGTPTPGG